MFINLKREFTRTSVKKLKKRNLKKKFLKHINTNFFKFRLFNYFLVKNKILMNHKVIGKLLLEEKGSSFGLKT